MNKKFLLMVFTSVFLLLAMVGAQFIMPASADPVIIRVPEDYPTIQKAINAASPGDTIQVASETYYENVTINKSLTLIGENRSTTIIDGNWTGYAVIYVTADNVDISGFAIQKGYNGIWLTSPLVATRSAVIQYQGMRTAYIWKVNPATTPLVATR